MKTILDGINSRLDEAENQISDLEDKVEKTPNWNNKKKKIIKTKDSLRGLWDNVKRNNICVLAGWLSWLERHPVHQRVAGLIPSQCTYLGCGFNHWLGGT